MDLHKIFQSISEQLISEFQRTAEIWHPGGKGSAREAALKQFLKDYLPQRYAIGSGAVISPENKKSGELDIIIYDPLHCPTLIKTAAHSIYPIESIYGAISVKSHLDSGELADAYQNIASLKSIVSKESFTASPMQGFAVGMGYPMPVTAIVAYDANRSLEAIAEQARKLDAKLPDITLRPDFIVVIGQGIIGSQQALRSGHNKYALPEYEALTSTRATGRHTLLRFYMQLLDELNALELRPFRFSRYYEMPRLIGPYRVRRHNRIARIPIEGEKDAGAVWRLNEAGIREIVSKSVKITYQEHLLHYIGQLPQGAERLNLNAVVYEYNPNKLPPINTNKIEKDKRGRPYLSVPGFQPIGVEIDDKQYAVDFSALTDKHFEHDPDFTVDELMSS
ncbi:MAG: hypothetical protein DI582_10020 [Azospirillum brasilense]|nr:MAG: hypothetical protein DI582_10020 [Azospirillum brasilense]